MTIETPVTPPQIQVPPRSGAGRWFKIALTASLAFNVLVVSAVATRMWRGFDGERMPGGAYVQLVPRKFLRDLPDDKREQAQSILRGFAKEARNGRQLARENANKLADAIAAEPYDVTKVKAVIDGFGVEAGQIAARGGEAAMQVIALLTPEQRQALAASIRERASFGKKRQ